MRLLTAVCLSVLSFAATAEAQNGTTRIDWPKGMSASDKRDVLALASRMGIAEPARVEFSRVLILGNRFLRVKSRALEDGHELRWNEVTMMRDSWQEYDDLPAERRTAQVGRWFAVGEKETMGKWRIRDGRWSIDIYSDPGVPYEAAERIVLAIRRRQLLNRQAVSFDLGVASQPRIPDLDPRHIGSIRRQDLQLLSFFQYTPPDPADSSSLYEVTYFTGDYTGLSLHVQIIGDDVELFGVGPFEI